MEQNTLGIILSYYREKYKFSMEELCSGICSIATLHRLESGSRELDSLMVEALLGRLGKEIAQFELVLNGEDYELLQKREMIQKMIQKRQYDDALINISRYKAELSEEQHLHWQICLAWEAKIKEALGRENDEIFCLASEAFAITKRGNFEEISGEPYNPLEIRMILLMISYGYFRGVEENEKILFGLIRFVERYYSGQIGEMLRIEIFLALIKIMEQNGEEDKVVSCIERALILIEKGRGLQYVAELHYAKARAIERRYGRSQSWKEQEWYCREECVKAYCVAQATDNTKLLKEIEIYCKEKLLWHITKVVTSFG